MSDGGLFQWKRQDIDQSRGPAASYDNIMKPLPPPPKDMHWVVDPKTREWRLEKKLDDDEIVVEATPVEDIDADGFFHHKVSSSDTFQGICLKYKITPTELRQANGGFSGSNLLLAPNPLRIPQNHVVVKASEVTPVGLESHDSMLRKLCQACPGLSTKEAKCYLELNDWDWKESLANAKDDGF